MNIKDRASKIRQLQKDTVFLEVMQAIRDKQISTFLNPAAPQESLVEAHQMIRAIDQFDVYFNSVFAEEAMFDKQQKGKNSV